RIANLEFQHGKICGGQNFFTDDLRRVKADAERGDVLIFAEAEAEKIVERPARAPGCAVEHREVQRVSGGDRNGRQRCQKRVIIYFTHKQPFDISTYPDMMITCE